MAKNNKFKEISSALKIPQANKNESAFIFASLVFFGVAVDQAYKIINPKTKATARSLQSNGLKYKNTIEVQKHLHTIDETLKKQYTTIQLKEVENLRDKDKLRAEINFELDSTTDKTLKLKLRQQLIDLDQLKKEDNLSDVIKPVIYLPDRDLL